MWRRQFVTWIVFIDYYHEPKYCPSDNISKFVRPQIHQNAKSSFNLKFSTRFFERFLSISTAAVSIMWSLCVWRNKLPHLRFSAGPTPARVDAHRGWWLWRCHSHFLGDSVSLQFAKIVICMKSLYFYKCKCYSLKSSSPPCDLAGLQLILFDSFAKDKIGSRNALQNIQTWFPFLLHPNEPQ